MSLTLASLKQEVDEQRVRDQTEKEELYRAVSALVKEKIRESLAVGYLAGCNTLDVDVSRLISEHSGNDTRRMYTSDMRKITMEVAYELRNLGLAVVRCSDFCLHIEGIKNLSL